MDVSKLEPPSVESLTPEAGWTPIEMPFSTSGGSSFVEGDPEGRRLRIRMFVRDADRRLFGKAWFGPEAEGPPGHAHGGSMAAVLDHTMGIAAWVSGIPVVAASITINFHRKLPLGAVVLSETWVEQVDGKKVYTAGRLYLDDAEKPFSSGTGVFIRQALEKFQGLMGEDPGWQANMKKISSNMRR